MTGNNYLINVLTACWNSFKKHPKHSKSGVFITFFDQNGCKIGVQGVKNDFMVLKMAFFDRFEGWWHVYTHFFAGFWMFYDGLIQYRNNNLAFSRPQAPFKTMNKGPNSIIETGCILSN